MCSSVIIKHVVIINTDCITIIHSILLIITYSIPYQLTICHAFCSDDPCIVLLYIYSDYDSNYTILILFIVVMLLSYYPKIPWSSIIHTIILIMIVIWYIVLLYIYSDYDSNYTILILFIVLNIDDPSWSQSLKLFPRRCLWTFPEHSQSERRKWK